MYTFVEKICCQKLRFSLLSPSNAPRGAGVKRIYPEAQQARNKKKSKVNKEKINSIGGTR
jgi:hypothetical protein